jgi:hypothetical protein
MDAQKMFDDMMAHFAVGGRVMISTYLKHTLAAPKHAKMFKVAGKRPSLFMQRGKNWDCIDYCAIRFVD